MKHLIQTLLTLALLYVVAACIVFQFRHPWSRDQNVPQPQTHEPRRH